MKKKKVRFVKESNGHPITDNNKKSTHSRSKQKISPATRTEVSSEVSLLKLKTQRKQNSRGFKKQFVSINDVLSDLKKTSSNEVDKLKVLQKKSKPIRVPLEKVHAKKIEREVAFDNVKHTLNRWDSTIQANRIADHLKFPLDDNRISIDEENNRIDENFLSTFREQTPLEKKMAELLGQSKVEKEEKEMEKNEISLTLAELIQRRKTFAKIRAQASFKAAKAWRQKKIKSKSYHRLLRRERLKQQIKDFESLKERDPEAALKQLELLEKTRAQERATLRHRNTGKWAKNQIIRAKYNAQSRAALSEQIQKNRELTKKRSKIVNSDDSDDTTNNDSGNELDETNNNNGKIERSVQNEFEHFLTEYRKYEVGLSKKDSNHPKSANVNNKAEKIFDNSRPFNNLSVSSSSSSDDVKTANNVKSTIVTVKNTPNNKRRVTGKIEDVTTIEDNDDSDDLMNENQKYFKNIDRTELLDERISANTNTIATTAVRHRVVDDEHEMKPMHECQVDINPDNFLTLRPTTQLHSVIPDLVHNGDDDLDDDDDQNELRHTIISEAFADDKLVSEFQDEKKSAVENSLPKNINLSLPGWGSWTGGKNQNNANEQNKKKRKIWIKNKRLLFKLPAAPPRKDANRGFLIIQEDKDPKLREHLANELPYPFTTVKGYESSIRTPIGREWVPETVHQDLITPQIKTKLGTVIKPMDVDELINRAHYEINRTK